MSDKKNFTIIMPTHSENLENFINNEETDADGTLAFGIIIPMLMILVSLCIVFLGIPLSDVVGPTGSMIINGVCALATCLFTCLIIYGVKNKKYLKALRNNLPVKPSRFLSKYGVFAYTVGYLSKRVDVLIGRWNRYREMRDIEYIDPLPNEEEMFESLRQLQEETVRHIKASNVVLKMEKEGDFVPQTTCDDSIVETLEQVRILEDQLRRSLNGVEHRLHSPLAVAANVTAMEQEMKKGFEETSPRLSAARAMGRKIAT